MFFNLTVLFGKAIRDSSFLHYSFPNSLLCEEAGSQEVRGKVEQGSHVPQALSHVASGRALSALSPPQRYSETPTWRMS